MALKLWLACRKPDAWGGRTDDGDALAKLDALLAGLSAEARSRGEEEA